MNFFEQQDKARKKTSKLVLYFILAVFFIIVAIDVLVVAAIIFGSNPDASDSIHYTINNEEVYLVKNGSFDFNSLFKIVLLVGAAVTPAILIIIGIGTLIRLYQTRGGGLSIAQMVKARPLDHSTNDFKEQRFINIVEEMSIASGVDVPQLFVMDNEPAINAFVAGYHPNDMVMVVTQGALETLDREALQGVVGHEFSHIFNGDMKINIRLIGLLGGIFAIGQLGSFILRTLQFRSSSSSSSSSSDTKGNGIFFAILIGIGLFIIGYIGLFFGRLIKAAISRQRESLADACSVQYTRNPQGLIQALSAIQENQKGSQLKSSHAEDINHMCFGPSLNMWFSTLLASHPPIIDRIHDLDPQGIYSQGIPHSSSQTTTFAPNTTMGFAGGAISANSIEQSIGHINQAQIHYATNMIEAIPEDIKSKCHDSNQVELILYAILMPTHDNVLYQQAESILKKQLDADMIAKIQDYGKQIDQLGMLYYLPIIDIAMPGFRIKSLDEKTKVVTILDQFVAVNPTLFTFSAVAMIKKSINLYTTPKNKNLKIANLLPEVSELIRFIISCGKQDAQTSSAIYQQVMQQFTNSPINEPKVNAFNAHDFQKLLAKLNMLAPLSKEKLLHACLSCIESDQQILIEEAECIRAIAACLNCPIPPIVPSTG